MAEAATNSTSEQTPVDQPVTDPIAQEQSEFDEQFGKPPVDGDPLKAPPPEEPEKLLAGKYKSVEDLEKGYKELTQHLRGKGVEPPETYEIKLPEGVDELTEDDVALFKELGLDNDRAQKLVDKLNETIGPKLAEARVKAEVAELGRLWHMDPESAGFKNRMDKIQAWASEHYPTEVLQALSQSAEGVQALVQAMEAQTPAQSAPVQHQLTKAQIDSLVQDERYWTDPGFREDVERRVRAASGG